LKRDFRKKKLEKKKIKIEKREKRHYYHLVDKSPWPLIVSIGVFFFTMCIGLYTTRMEYSLVGVYWNLIVILIVMYNWWADVNIESTFLGAHTKIVVRGLWLGFLLFMASEVMIFFSFFLELFSL